MDEAFRTWAAQRVKHDASIIKLGYFGSYARGDWGVGSDLDVIAIVDGSEQPFERRSVHWDVNQLPVPTQIIVYTLKEWESLRQQANRFVLTLEREAVWAHEEQ